MTKIEKQGDSSVATRKADERVEWLKERLPETMSTLQTLGTPPSCVEELYRALSPFGADVTPSDIDDTLGPGMSDLLEQESRAADGGIFGEGGITAGGIFGADPVATNVSDPAADHRGAAQRSHRLLLGEPPQKAVPKAVKKLSEHRRARLLGEGDP